MISLFSATGRKPRSHARSASRRSDFHIAAMGIAIADQRELVGRRRSWRRRIPKSGKAVRDCTFSVLSGLFTRMSRVGRGFDSANNPWPIEQEFPNELGIWHFCRPKSYSPPFEYSTIPVRIAGWSSREPMTWVWLHHFPATSHRGWDTE